MNSTNMAIVWICLVAAFVAIMFFVARGGKEKSGDNGAKRPDDESRPSDVGQPQAGGADKRS